MTMFKNAYLQGAAAARQKLAEPLDTPEAEALRNRIHNVYPATAALTLGGAGGVLGHAMGRSLPATLAGGAIGAGLGYGLGRFTADRWSDAAERGDYGFRNSRFERFNHHPAGHFIVGAAPLGIAALGYASSPAAKASLGAAALLGGAGRAYTADAANDLARLHGHRE